MKTPLHKQVLGTIRRHRMIQAGDRVGVGVSGGADSVALLLLLEELRSELGISLVVLHFNHRLRGASADADAQFVRDLANSHDLEIITSCEDVAARARKQRANLEETARQCRYDFFSDGVETAKANVVAVGHTRDDQAETVLARVIRGTGPLGLAGIYPVAGHVIRPLLDVRRQWLREYLVARGQPWREDESNRDTSRLRSRIRQRLLPPLEQDFSPAIVAHLGKLAELARGDEAFWNRLLEDRFRALVVREPKGMSICVSDLLRPMSLGEFEPTMPASQDPLYALTLRLIRRIVEEVQGDRRRLTAQHVQQVIHLAAESFSGRGVQLTGGLAVERRFDRLLFLPAAAAGAGWRNESVRRSGAYSYLVELPREGAAVVEVAEIGKRLRLKLVDWSEAARDTRGAAGALDADSLHAPLVLRSWQPGDAYRPKGRRHSQKLKRLLLGNRVPWQDRAGWPVLTSAGRLVWACRLPAAAEFAATAATRKGLVITEEAGWSEAGTRGAQSKVSRSS